MAKEEQQTEKKTDGDTKPEDTGAHKSGIFYGDGRKVAVKTLDAVGAVSIAAAFFLFFTVHKTLANVLLVIALSSFLFAVYLTWLPTLRKKRKRQQAQIKAAFVFIEIIILASCGGLEVWLWSWPTNSREIGTASKNDSAITQSQSAQSDPASITPPIRQAEANTNSAVSTKLPIPPSNNNTPKQQPHPAEPLNQTGTPIAMRFSDFRVTGVTDKTMTVRFSYVYDGAFGKDGCRVNVIPMKDDGTPVSTGMEGENLIAVTHVLASMGLVVRVPSKEERDQIVKFELSVDCPDRHRFGFREFAYPEPVERIEGYMEGYVHDDQTNRPLQSALIIAQHLESKEEYRIVTDSGGHFARVLPFGEYKVTISYPGYITVSGSCHPRKEENCFVDFGRLQKAPPN